MNNDRQYSGLQLISPPPEESLRRISKAFSPAPNVKRKRTQAPSEEPQPQTPNPRSRKQLKQRGDTPASPSPLKAKRITVQSPHGHNPNADYIPPTTLVLTDAGTNLNNRPLSRRSRSTSATPIPPYEPPSDIFTPPKEVFITPVTATIKVSKSSKRKSTTRKKKPTPAPVVVKLEMPDVDFNAPMPPPSPGDDPLLLSSSVEPPSSTPTRPRTRSPWMAFSEPDALPVGRDAGAPFVRRTVSPTPLPFHKLRFEDLPPSSPPEEDQPSPIIEDEDLDITPPEMPFFELGDNANNDNWSDSGDELPMLPPALQGSPSKEGEGEFTGKFLEVLIKTKADPPSSVTRGRIDEWGNPKSPYPLSLEKSPFPLPREKRRADLDALKEAEEREDEEREEEEEVRRMSVEPELEQEEPNPFDFTGIANDSQEHMPVEQQPEEPSIEYDVPLRDDQGSPGPRDIEVDEDVLEGPSAEDAFRLMGNRHDEELSPEEPPDELQYPEDEEAQITVDADPQPSSIEEDISPSDESTSHSLDDPDEELELAPTLPEQPQPMETEINIEVQQDYDVSDDEHSSSSEGSASPDIVKITSADPRAAARAAAILKQHNYDCFTKREMKRRYPDISRRRTMSPGTISARGVLGGGIEKKERRKTIGTDGMGVRGEKVYIPGSPMTTLPKLLRDAEAEVSMSMSMSMAVDQNYSGSPNPFMLRGLMKDKVDSYKTPLPSRVFSPVLPSTQGLAAEGSMTALANKIQNSLLLTPKVPMTPGEMCYDPLTGERMWTKEEWKRLDACFTDERIEVGKRMGLVGSGDESVLVDGWEKWEGMASVDEVRLEDVVERFVDWMGGWVEVEGYGPEWSREDLMSRAKALRSKQRKGKVAPPTSLPFSPSTAFASMSLVSPSPFDFSFVNASAAEMDVPQFTPIRRTARPGMLRKRREWASVVGPTSSTPRNGGGEMDVSASTPVPRIQQDAEVNGDTGNARFVPKSLLAPRYSHLWEEAITVSKDLPDVKKSLEDARESDVEKLTEQEESDTVLEQEQESEGSRTTATLVEDEGNSIGFDLSEEVFEEEEVQEESFEQEQEQEPEPEPATIGKRVKGILFSYLPTLKRTPNTTTTHNNRKLKSRPSTRPGLPLPPKEVLSKPRGPVVTPARGPIPKPVHPKELVHLQQAPPIQPPASKIPTVVHPKQLVELNHVTPKVREEERQRRQRRSSGASVKDLINGFEKMEKEREVEGGRGSLDGQRREVRRMKSVGEWRKDVERGSVEVGRPVWKP